MENKVINVQMDEETFKKFQNIDVPTEGGGSGVEADDIMFLSMAYFDATINLSKATASVPTFENAVATVSIEDGYIESDGIKLNVVSVVLDSIFSNALFLPCKEEKILRISDSLGVTDYSCIDSGITVVYKRYISDDFDETEEITGTLIYHPANGPIVGINVNGSIVLVNDDKFISIKKIIASNGREYIYEQE
jgi:hypothetical protein